MKYCTQCGKELVDEAILCPGCGKEISKPEAATNKTMKTKHVNKGKTIKILIAIVAAILIIVGGMFGFFLFRNNVRAEGLENQLVGKTFEYANIDATYEFFMVYRISFGADGQCKIESVTEGDEKVREQTGEYSVKVGFNGTQDLYIDNTVYNIAVDASGEIENLSWGSWSYYPIQHEDGENLTDWLEAVQKIIKEKEFQETLEANKKAALEMFASVSYWETGDCFNNLIPIIFKDYTLTCEPVRNSCEEFIITVSGPYYFNKVQLPNLTRNGEITCRVTIGLDESVVQIQRDDGIVDAMDLYVVLSTYGSYGW